MMMMVREAEMAEATEAAAGLLLLLLSWWRQWNAPADLRAGAPLQVEEGLAKAVATAAAATTAMVVASRGVVVVVAARGICRLCSSLAC